MPANVSYRQEGEAIDYTPSAAVAAGDVVVQAGLIGVAKTAIAASALGAITTEGVFRFTKATGALVAGSKVYWDATNLRVSRDPSVGEYIGRTIASAASGDTTVDVLVRAFSGRNLALSAEAASTAVSNTTTETNFDNSTFTIPANSLNIGDVIRVRAQGIATSTNSTDTLNLKVKLGSTAIIATGAVDVANNDIGILECDIVVRTIGASGTIVAAGSSALGADGTVTMKATKLASTTLDTTAAITAGISATWSVASASNSCRLDVCDWEILRKS